MNLELEQIGLRMRSAGLPRWWVLDVIALAQGREGVDGLARMWRDAEDDAERDECVACLQECLDAREPSPDRTLIRSRRDLEASVTRMRALKAHLRKLIEDRGGISEIARRADMPQPSLSRLLNSGAEPRKSTMARLAAAMGVSVSRLFPNDAEEEGDAEVFDLEEHRMGRHLGRPHAPVRARGRA